jgi:hypothetical protein
VTPLTETGKRNSAVDQAYIQQTHDNMVALGAGCDTPAKEAKRGVIIGGKVADCFVEILRVDDSLNARLNAISNAVRMANIDPDDPYGGPYAYVRDLFDDAVIAQIGDTILQYPYSIDANNVVTLGPPTEVDIAYVPSDDGATEVSERKIPAGARLKLSVSDAETVTPKEAAKPVELAELVELVEMAVDTAGNAQIKIIQPGWGSSGYYPAEVLKRDGPKVFSKGTQMFWNHQTAAEEAARPEGDLNDLASELTEDAQWQPKGPKGPGLYAPIQVHEHYRNVVNALAPSMGVSIRAMGKAKQGKAEGREGPVIESIAAAKSIDYVTAAGAGGEVLALFEAARTTSRLPVVEKPAVVETTVENTQLLERVTALETQNKELLHATALNEAATFVANKLKGVALPAQAIARLQRDLAIAPDLKENRVDIAVYGARIEQAIKDEAAYVSALSGSGRIVGLGESTVDPTDAATVKAAEERIAASFVGMGLKESTAKIAARGRC